MSERGLRVKTVTPRLDERRQAGKRRRATIPRTTLGDCRPVERDPLDLIRQASNSRVPALVGLRHARMLASPFAFFRGGADLQAFDLAGEPHTGIAFPICGDCHLMNFGGFATPERNLVFDINDFDEADLGPWEWDLKRLAASVFIAALHLGHGAGGAEAAAWHAAARYRASMGAYAEMGALELNYQRHKIDSLLSTVDDETARGRLKRLIVRAERRTHENLLPKIAVRDGDTWTIKDSPPTVFHLFGAATLLPPDDDWLRLGKWQAVVDKMYRKYLSTLPADRRALLDHFQMQDLTFKVVGVGSVGTRCLILLLVDSHGRPLFLQIKEAADSVLARRQRRKRLYPHGGRRVVEGQKRLQSASDLFLGWSTGPSGRHFYFRQLRDMKISATVETYDNNLLVQYAAICGEVLARAHAKSGGFALEISGYIGKSDAVPDAIVRYAKAYSEQVQRDFETFRAACQRGDLPVRTDEDFLLDVTA
jgi:uncharacterized protein (DUF2252 family)